MFGTVRYKLLVSSTCNRRQRVRKGDGRPELFEQLLRETSDFSRAAGWPSPVLFFIPSFFLQIWPSLLLLSQEVATLTPSDISVTEVGLKHNTLFKNPTKSKNAIKLQTLQLWCRWSGKRSLLQTHRHWLGISGWRVQREVKQKGLSKMKRIKQKIQQVKSSAEKYFHSPPPPHPPHYFFPTDTFTCCVRLSYSHVILQTMKTHTRHAKASPGELVYHLANTLMRQISCSSFPFWQFRCKLQCEWECTRVCVKENGNFHHCLCYSGYSHNAFLNHLLGCLATTFSITI